MEIDIEGGVLFKLTAVGLVGVCMHVFCPSLEFDANPCHIFCYMLLLFLLYFSICDGQYQCIALYLISKYKCIQKKVCAS